MMYCAAWAAIREQHRLGVLSDRNLFFRTSGGLKSKIKVLAGLVSSKTSLTGLQVAAFCVPSVSPHGLSSVHGQREVTNVSSSFCKNTSPIRLGLHLNDFT